MNYYVTLMRDVIDYIEASLRERLVLEQVAEKFGFSEYHFNRIFKAVVGISLKQYIGARKLTEASKLLRNKVPVIEGLL